MGRKEDKPRPDYQKIRSLEIEMGMEPSVPPDPTYEAVRRMQRAVNACGMSIHEMRDHPPEPKVVEK